MGSLHRTAAVLLWIAAAAASQAADPPRYTIQRMESAPSFLPRGFNTVGDVVGYKLRSWDFDYDGDRVAYLQPAGSAPRLIADAPQGREYSMLVAINASGLAVGRVRVEPTQIKPGVSTYGYRADAVRRSGQRIDLVSLLPEGADSEAVDVNSSGQVAGSFTQWSEEDQGFYTKPFIWSEAAGMQFPVGSALDGPDMVTSSINEAGQLAGSIDGGDYYAQLFVWDPEKGLRTSRRSVGSVDGGNDRGQVVGTDFYRRGYVWTAATGKVGLPRTASKPNSWCQAYDINDAGFIVGNCPYGKLALWAPEANGQYTITPLTDLIDFPPDFPRWRFDWAYHTALRIDSDGRILIVGDDYTGVDQEAGFSAILTPIP